MTTNTQPQTQQSGGDELTAEEYAELQAKVPDLDLTKPWDILTAYGRACDTKLAEGLGRPDCVSLILQLIQARERAARVDELRLLAAEVKLSKPRNKFVYNKYLRIAYFNERMAQLQPQAGEGGDV